MPEDEIDTTPTDPSDPAHIKNLRKKAEGFDKLETEKGALARELAFTKAGFDTDHPLVANLMTTYGGELTKDAVKAHMDGLKVTELVTAGTAPVVEGQGDGGPGEGQQQGGEQTGVQGAGQQTATRLATVEGGEAGGSVPTDDPRMVGLTKAFDAMDKGMGREAASQLFMQEIFGAAAKGDARVLIAERKGGE